MNSSIQPRKFWTPKRVVFSFVIFALIASIGYSSCSTPTPISNDNNVPKTNDGKPGTTVTASDPNSAPVVTPPLPASVIGPIVRSRGRRILQQDVDMLGEQTANIRRFGGERYASTRIDVLGPHIWRLLRTAERGEDVDATRHEERLTLRL